LGTERFREFHEWQVDDWLSRPFLILAHCDLEICGFINGLAVDTKTMKKRPLKFEEDYGKSEFFG
jgi:hypothetical protein